MDHFSSGPVSPAVLLLLGPSSPSSGALQRRPDPLSVLFLSRRSIVPRSVAPWAACQPRGTGGFPAAAAALAARASAAAKLRSVFAPLGLLLESRETSSVAPSSLSDAGPSAQSVREKKKNGHFPFRCVPCVCVLPFQVSEARAGLRLALCHCGKSAEWLGLTHVHRRHIACVLSLRK